MDYGGLSDTGFGLNIECFVQGLLYEALRQLAGLRRRKNALSMLSASIKSGIKKRESKLLESAKKASRKRPRDSDDNNNPSKKQA